MKLTLPQFSSASVLVVGDYIAEQIVGYEEVTQYGGSVQILDFVDGCSTTQIIQQIAG